MQSIDWRIPAAYKRIKDLPPAGFAWEYLRRDADYHRDYRAISRDRKPSTDVLEAFTRRWGLRFPERP